MFLNPDMKFVITDPSKFPIHLKEGTFSPLGGLIPVLVSVELDGITELQHDGHCDYCRAPIRAGEDVLGKGLNLETSSDGKVVSSIGGFSPTCLECLDRHPEWLVWLITRV